VLAGRARRGVPRLSGPSRHHPRGDVDPVDSGWRHVEADDLAASLFGVATSTDPFDVWFRGHVQEMHGIDLAAGMNLPEQVLDHSA